MPRVSDSKKKRKPHRGKRNAETAERKTAKWVESGGLERVLAKIESTTGIKTLPEYPDHFLSHRGRAQVTATLAKHFPDLTLDQLYLEREEEKLLYPTPSLHQLDPMHPPYLAARYHNVLKVPAQMALLNAWHALNALNVKYPKPEPQRSKASPALHLGIWETYRLIPIVTTDSRNQPAEVIPAMDFFLSIIGKLIAPRLRTILRREFPCQYSRQQRAYERVLILLDSDLKARPALDFGGAFFTVAAKEGSSEILHLDFNDERHSISWVVPLGDWTGGEFCLPQLGVKIPLRPGQVLVVMTKNLVHCTAPITNGKRIVLTLFCDQYLLKHGDEFLNVPVIDYSP